MGQVLDTCTCQNMCKNADGGEHNEFTLIDE